MGANGADADDDAESLEPGAEPGALGVRGLILDIAISEPVWAAAFDAPGDAAPPALLALCERAAQAALDQAEAGAGRAAISLLFTGDAEMRRLNAAHRGAEKPTNVLSWPSMALGDAARLADFEPDPEGSVFLGDIALSYETIQAEATAAGRALSDHTAHLIIHGVLHLLGHDHENDADADRMESLERRAMAAIGAPDPYPPAQPAAQGAPSPAPRDPRGD